MEKYTYTEEEVIAILHSAFYDIGYYIDVVPYPDGTTDEVSGIRDWFNQKYKNKSE